MQSIQSNSNSIKPTMGRDRYGHSLSVALPISPVKKLDITNVTLRKYDRYTGNTETIAWEKHLLCEIGDEDLNFIKDFYLEGKLYNDDEFYFRYIDSIRSKYLAGAKEAYTLAKDICKQLVAEDLIKTQRLIKNRKQVTQRIRQTLGTYKQTKNEDILRWKTGIKKLFHEMRDAIQHILDAGGEKEFFRLEELIKQKQHITEDFLKGLPNRNIQEINKYLQSIRLFLSKKTDEYQQHKLELGDDFHFDEKTIREMSRSSLEDTASCYSDKLTEIRAHSKREKQKEAERKIEKFYDLNQLKNKWKNTNIDQLKGTIRRVLVKETLSEAEHIRARAYRLEQEKKGIQILKIEQPKKSKLTAQQRIQDRKEKKDKRSVAEQQKKHTLTREEMKTEQLKQEFFTKYNPKSSIGEQFSAAVGYNNLF
ncbi:unnamed protein product [Paramecium primaurelia]|uniref:Uncharacterized protein n=1 Tax=Paramecium primaurelia TaxID=5886 RepID=A0A8S1PD95_PARPR|nr:unnamed protein product [Paramecium primaurelia]